MQVCIKYWIDVVLLAGLYKVGIEYWLMKWRKVKAEGWELAMKHILMLMVIMAVCVAGFMEGIAFL